MKKMKVLFWICVTLHVFVCQNQYSQVFADQFAVEMDIDEVEAMKVAEELGLIFVGEVIIHNCSFNVVNFLKMIQVLFEITPYRFILTISSIVQITVAVSHCLLFFREN